MFPIRSDTNRSVQSLKKAGSLNFWVKLKRCCTICVAKTKALISFHLSILLVFSCSGSFDVLSQYLGEDEQQCIFRDYELLVALILNCTAVELNLREAQREDFFLYLNQLPGDYA